MIHEQSFRFRVLDDNQVYVNLNDVLELLQNGQEDPDLSASGKHALETVERTMLELGIHALVTSTNEALDRIERLL